MTSPPNNPRYALALLLAVNLLNYIDRQALYAVFPLIKSDLVLSDTALGFLGSAFMFVYMCSAPVLGWLGDRWSRIRLASFGLACWSIATVFSGLATGYRTLLASRALVGVGEASFGTVSPGLIADHFPTERRGRVLSAFYLAIPVGSALGYVAGGYLGHHFGWKTAFLMVGVPGLLLVPLVWRLREPLRNGAEAAAASGLAAYTAFFRNRSFVLVTLAMAAMTFALGGLAQWVPTFLCRTHGLDVGKANMLFGAITVVAGIAGTATGGWLGDLLQRRTKQGYLLVSGVGFVLGTPAAAWAILASDVTAALSAIFVAEFFLFLNTGPLNTVIVNVSPARARAMAFALNIFFIHALGDAISPAIIGAASDRFGLQKALLLAPATVLVAAFFCFVCGKFIAADLVTED